MTDLSVQLIRPPYKTDSICPPINLMALAAHVEPHFPVSITDFVLPYIHDEMSLDAQGIVRAARRVLETETPVLGFTSMCSSYAAALRIAQECKRQDPDRYIVMGGPHASFVHAETLKAFDFVDAVIVGEGEGPLLKLLGAVKDQRTLDGIRGLSFRRGGEIIHTEPGPVVDDLDSLPLPAFHLIPDPSLYFGTDEERFIEIEVGRGCPFACTFCSTSAFFSRKYRVKSPARVVQEMRWLKQHWNVASMGLIHDNLTSNKKKVWEFCKYILDCGESFRWHCSSRTDTIDRPLMEIMRAAGCQSIFFGVETGSDEMQKIMGKRLKVASVRETFKNLGAVGIDSTASFIIGFPEETPAMLEQTLQMALDLRLTGVRDIQLHPLSALPGTQLLDKHEERLVFDPRLLSFHDITSVIDITETERRWIQANRRIFSNFYAVQPLHYPLELVHRIRGCYFYLAHFRPFALQCIHRIVGLTHVAIVERLCAHLPATFEEWQPDALIGALNAVIAGLDGEKRFIQDIVVYEEMIAGLSCYSDGGNGWIHFKGRADAKPAAGPQLRPARSAALHYDVLAAIGAMRQNVFSLPPPRDMHLAVVLEADTWRLRAFEVDGLTSGIIGRVSQGAVLTDVLHDLAGELDGLGSGQELDWVEELLTHLDTVGLLATSTRPGWPAGGGMQGRATQDADPRGPASAEDSVWADSTAMPPQPREGKYRTEDGVPALATGRRM